MKIDLAARLKEAGQRPTPVLIEKELARLERSVAALAAIEAVAASGGKAYYHQVDLTDAAAVRAVMATIREINGHVDVLLHAAGVEISRALPDKEPREFDLVFDVKTEGWFNLLHAAADLHIGAVVAFSSVAGRFGNAGQTDYSAANDLLCKLVSNLRRTRPTVHGIAIDWTAWAGIGMATRGSVPKIMELAGVEMLDAGDRCPVDPTRTDRGVQARRSCRRRRTRGDWQPLPLPAALEPLGATDVGPMIGTVEHPRGRADRAHDTRPGRTTVPQ